MIYFSTVLLKRVGTYRIYPTFFTQLLFTSN